MQLKILKHSLPLLLVTGIMAIAPSSAAADDTDAASDGQVNRRELIERCRANPDDSACQQRREHRQARRERIRALCAENPTDEKCARFQERQNKRARIKALCSEDPDNEVCHRVRKHMKDVATDRSRDRVTDRVTDQRRDRVTDRRRHHPAAKARGNAQ